MASIWLALTLGLAGPAHAQVTTTTLYKSTGPDGRISYSDRPAPDARASQAMSFRHLPASPLSAQTQAYVAQWKQSAEARAAQPAPSTTVLYSAAWCGYCKQAKAYLARQQVDYREVDIDTRDGALAYARAGGGRGVPMLQARGQTVVGYSATAYDALFSVR